MEVSSGLYFHKKAGQAKSSGKIQVKHSLLAQTHRKMNKRPEKFVN
jgi:hypothetical protein